MKEKLVALLATVGDERPDFEVICAAYAKVHNTNKLHMYAKIFLEAKYIIKDVPLSDFIVGDYYRYKEWEQRQWKVEFRHEIKPSAIGGLIQHERLTYEQAVVFIKTLYNEKYGEALEEEVCKEVLNEVIRLNLRSREKEEVEDSAEMPIKKDAATEQGSPDEVLNKQPESDKVVGFGITGIALISVPYYYLSFRIKPAFLSPISALGTTGVIINLGIGAVIGGAIMSTYFAIKHFANKQSSEDIERTSGL